MPSACSSRGRPPDHQITGEAADGLYDDMAGTVSRDVDQQRREARAGLDRVGAGDGRIVELADDPVLVGSGERLDRLPLALVAMLLGADVARAGGPEVGDLPGSVFPFWPLA
jgi:hypothetical protein